MTVKIHPFPGREAFVLENDDLTTKPYQVALVSGTFASQLAISLYCLREIFSSAGSFSDPLSLLSPFVVTASSLAFTYILADLGSGIFHWSVDNYGNGRTPVLGNIIAAFQGHHTAPWTITERGFCNNVHKLCYPFGPILPLASLLLLPSHPLFTTCVSFFCFTEIMSQELHKWSHMPPSEAPALANALQKLGLTIPRQQHNKHHTLPFSGNYCIVSGHNNGWVDGIGLCRMLERAVYEVNGVESNSWKLDEELKERTLRGEYRPVKCKRQTDESGV